jgi:hypothetical protein
MPSLQAERSVVYTDRVSFSKAFFAGLAELNLANPLRLEDLSSREAARGMRVQHGVDDVATTGL